MARLTYFSVVALLVAAVACRNSKSAGDTGGRELSRNEWKLTELNGKPVPSASKAQLAFRTGGENQVSGSTGCNRLSGRFELGPGNSLRFPPLAVTKMACMDEGAGQLEQEFLQALGKVTSWEATGELLRLKANDAVVATFREFRQPTKEEARLNGTWELYYISGPRIAFEGLFPNKKPTLVLQLPDTQASGNGGCNGYGCPVKVNGSKISFGDPLSTMMACEGNGEPEYFKTLKTVDSYTLQADTVLALHAGDVPVLRFRRK